MTHGLVLTVYENILKSLIIKRGEWGGGERKKYNINIESLRQCCSTVTIYVENKIHCFIVL